MAMSSVDIVASIFRAAAQCPSLRPAVLPEIAAFAVGAKPSLRFVVSADDASLLHTSATDVGLISCSKSVFLASVGNGWYDIVDYSTNVSQELIVISSDKSAEKLLAAELCDPGEAGYLLGYPECCVRAISGLAATSDQWAIHLLKGASMPIDARLNRFAAEWGGIGLIGELFPCSLNCAAAARYAQSLYDSAVILGLYKLAEAAKLDALAAVSVNKRGRIALAKTKGNVEFVW